MFAKFTFQLTFFSLLTLLCTTPASAQQQKKELDHSVYDGWQSIRNTTITTDGRYVATIIAPQEGDSILVINDTHKKRELQIDRATTYSMSPDGKYCVASIKAPFAERREARIKKKKPDDMPKDSLAVIDLKSFDVLKIADVKSFRVPRELNRHIVYETTLPPDTAKNKRNAKPKKVFIVRNLSTQTEDTVLNVKSSLFSKYGNALAMVIEPEKTDSLDKPGILFFDFDKNVRKRISERKADYRSLSFDEQGKQLVYLSSTDTSKIAQKVYDVRYFSTDTANLIADKNTTGLPENWIFNEWSAPRFSKSGKRIIIGAAPMQAPKDTTIVDFEMASLDVWNWKDPVVQPQQLVELRRELSKTYTGIIFVDQPNKFVPIATPDMPDCRISNEDDGRFALLSSTEPYRLETQWDISPKIDLWIWDAQTNKTTQIEKALAGRAALSPAGNFTYWWNGEQLAWFAYDNHNGTTANLTAAIPVNFWNEKNDTPSMPGAYGVGAWGTDDSFVLLYDAYDIWKIDPKGTAQPQNITLNVGRSQSITFKYVNTDPEKRFLEPTDVLLLSAFNNESKENGFYTLKQKGRNPLQKHVMGGFTFPLITKAREANAIVYQKGNFSIAPDLYLSTNLWKSEQKLVAINPQMKDYNWGTAELYSWTSFDGHPLQGILYKPENFDPAKKYPLMIYFYERHSDNLYQSMSPAPSRSTVNIPFFVSREYVVFTPDIRYTVGHPGRDAYNSIVAGAQALAKNSWIDEDNIAIQGQSWGGYQTAFLITQTDMFKAAGSGAPVSNMTSAYGGIRWESGRSRQFQYEQTQSRIGATMSDSLHLYIENSPIFFAKNVNTPLLIMHNDRDGAVPWYQGIEYFMMLRRLGKPVWMLQYNNEDHNLRLRRNAKDLSIRLQQFFDHYLKGAPAPKWMTEGVPATMKGKTWGYELDDSGQ